MSKTQIKVISAFLIVVAIFGGIKAFQIYRAIQNGKYMPPPESVTTAQANQATWEDTFDAVATISSVNGATLSAQEAGKVVKINFESGTPVQVGAVLVEIDSSVERAQLTGAIASQARQKKAFDRAIQLRQTNAISIDQYDSTVASYDQAVSQVESLKASIERKKIISPIDGKAGIRLINVGDYVTAGQAVVPVYSLQNIYVNFSVPQQYLGKIHVGEIVTISSDTTAGKTFPGKINALNPNVSETTRNASVQATVENPEELLRPGMFVNCSIALDQSNSAIAVPITSINSAPYGDSVFIVEKGENDTQTVRQQFIKVGSKRGDLIQIISGVKPGEVVVTSGLFKLRPGATIQVHNELAPTSDKNPTPQDT